MTDIIKDAALVQALGNAARESAIVQIGLDGTILAANEAYAAIVGVSAAALAGRNWSEAYKGVSPAALDAVLGRCRAGETVVAQVTRRALDGRSLLLHGTFVPVRDAYGAVHHVAVAVVDMSAEHVAARRQADLFQALSRSQAMIEFTPTGEIVDANRNFLDCLGYQHLSDIVGRHHRIFVDRAEAASPHYSAFWAALARGENQSAEFRRIRRDGEPVWIVATYSSVTDEDGKVVRIVKFASDVTSRKRTVSRLIDGISAMAAGDLSARLGPPEDTAFGEVFATFDTALTGLADVVEDLRARTATMNDEAAEIATGADELARRGESQAASLEQTAAAVEQISGNISTTSQSARDADSATRSAENIVRIGATTVGRAIESMVRIDEHTRRMGEFTRVIENFAFQTNLLSINAAVEAARAGEVGRGFAVVANEVRNLAQQSAKASQSIADLIGKSEAEVTIGVRLVKDAGGALDQIRAAVEAMAGSVAGIAHATTEQATGVREVSQTLAQLDRVNQSNLSLSDSNAAGAAALAVQVKEMQSLLGHFRTQDVTVRVRQPRANLRPRRSA